MYDLHDYICISLQTCFVMGNNLNIYPCIYILPASKDYTQQLWLPYILRADLDAGLLSGHLFSHTKYVVLYICSTVFISIDVHFHFMRRETF